MGVSIHHIDLAVSDVDRSLAFYLGLLGPFGLREAGRFPTYRGTEEVVYLAFGDQYLGLRQADGGEYRYYDVGVEHLAFYVEKREDVDAAHRFALDTGMSIHFPPEEDKDIPGFYEMFVFDPDGLRIEVGVRPARARSTSARALAGMERDDRRLEALKQVLDAFNRHDLDAIMSHFADDCVLEIPAWARALGKPLRGQG